MAGIVVAGHGIASGRNRRDGVGSIALQLPHFKDRGLDLGRVFHGTINVSIAPAIFRIIDPTNVCENVRWTDEHPPETFSFVPIRIATPAGIFDAHIYYPHPETKRSHFQSPSVVEVLTERIDGMQPGASVELYVNSARVDVMFPPHADVE